MARRSRSGRRSPREIAAERRAAQLARGLGASIRNGRQALAERQRDSAQRAGVSQQTFSSVERGADPRVTLATLCRCAMAVDSDLHAYLERISSADRPRDSVHLRHQELILGIALAGGWKGVPEAPLDQDSRTSRSLDVLLTRRMEWVVVEIWDWFEDVGRAFRDWDRRLGALQRLAISRTSPTDGTTSTDPIGLPRTGGVWVVRGTRRNRELITQHGNVFRARFPTSGATWIRALSDPHAAMPSEPALLWVSVDGARIHPARL